MMLDLFMQLVCTAILIGQPHIIYVALSTIYMTIVIIGLDTPLLIFLLSGLICSVLLVSGLIAANIEESTDA